MVWNPQVVTVSKCRRVHNDGSGAAGVALKARGYLHRAWKPCSLLHSNLVCK